MQRQKRNSNKTDSDNRANQLNRNNDAYWRARNHDQRPDDWKSRESQDRQNSTPKREGE